MEIFRDQAAILVILFNNSDYVNGLSLADYNRVGIKTLKKDIDYLNGICKINGCEIISKVSIGYHLQINNRDRYNAFRNEVERKYYNFFYYRNAQSERVHYIIRQCLLKDGINIKSLTDKCNYSESTIRRDIISLKAKAEKYDLKFVNKTNKGVFFVGDEWNIRLALANEYYIYKYFDKVYFQDEEIIDDILMKRNGLNKTVYVKLIKTLKDNNYYVSYENLMSFGDMILIFLSRRKFADKLKYNSYFNSIDLSIEKDIILSLFNSIEGENSNILSDIELNYLAAYLKGKKVFRFFEFEQSDMRLYVEKIVDGFLNYLNNYYDVANYDITVLRKDLCCEITSMIIRTSFDVHINSKLVHQFKSDGLSNLDLCSLLYRYLKEYTDIKCNKDDTAMLYYCFSFFSKSKDKKHGAKIMVVSKNGFFYSRSLAYQFKKLLGRHSIEFVPVEYLRLKEEDIVDIAGFITDIECLKEEYPNHHVVDSHFLRRRSEVRKAVDYIIGKNHLDMNKIFTKENIHYVNKFKDFSEVETYIRNNIFTKQDNADVFFSEFYKRNSVYNSRRNNILVVNTIGDFIGRDLLHIISLEEFMPWDKDNINKVIVYNSAGRSLFNNSLITKRVGKLLNSYQLFFIGDRDSDYAMLQRIMFE